MTLNNIRKYNDDWQLEPMMPSWFRLSDEAVEVARNMLDAESAGEFYDLRAKFMRKIPYDKACFFGTDIPADNPHAVMFWHKGYEAGYMTLFDPGDNLVAVVSKDDIMYTEDFADVMRGVGLETNAGDFSVVWRIFAECLGEARSLRECAENAAVAAKWKLQSLSVDEIMNEAVERDTKEKSQNKEFVLEYKGLTIYGKDGLFTVGGPHNAEFGDCTLENLEYGPEEIELVAYCRENGIPLRFDDLRGHVYDVPYEKYLEHLEKYKVDPEGDFTDYEFIVPFVRCVSLEQAMQFVDWIDAMERAEISAVLDDANTKSKALYNGFGQENNIGRVDLEK